jgi:hypothetical protein
MHLDELIKEHTVTQDDIKQILMNGITLNEKDDDYIEIKNILDTRIDVFMKDVIIPLQSSGNFDINKINWYFALYKEGFEAQKVKNRSVSSEFDIESLIEKYVNELQHKTITELLDYGTSYLSFVYTLITSFHRDNLILERLKIIYNTPEPVDWIYNAQLYEKELLEINIFSHSYTSDILKKISKILSKRL